MKRKAFTLVELLVVIAVIAILSTIAVISYGAVKSKSRNDTRKDNLSIISKALDLYRAENNAYPNTNGVLQGACQSYGSLSDSGAAAWIPGLAPGYLQSLPHDPNTDVKNPSSDGSACRNSAGQNCYLYVSDGTDYALLAHCTPEGHLSSGDQFYARSSGKGQYAWEVCSLNGCTKW
jgi:prepilin-type N-terminal cleavage/methylation domain-containing protein